MNAPWRFSLRAKLFYGILIPAAILVVVIFLDYANLGALGRSAETILAKNYKSIQAAHQINRVIQNRQDWLAAALLGQAPPVGDHSRDDQDLSQAAAVCRNNVTEPGERELAEELAASLVRYQDLFASLRQAQAKGMDWTATNYRRLLQVQNEVETNLAQLIAVNEQAMARADQETQRVAQQARIYSIALLAAAAAFTLVFSFFISRRISRPLVDLARSITQLRQDRQEYPRLEVRGQDELAVLTTEFNRLFERLQEFDQANLQKLNAEQRKVLEAEQAKSRFIADLSHQLKTPMTSLGMSVNLLARHPLPGGDERLRRLLETAVEDCGRLSALINELVDLSRLEAMATPRPRELINLPEMIETCLRPLFLQAEEKGVSLTTRYGSALPAVNMDSFRFPWVITNLVGNALRYTPPGGRINLEVTRDGGRVNFRCQDSGSGIRPEYLPHIFDRYAQFAAREAMGTVGLGLAIVKEIIEQHRGDISVSSRLGEGTTFDFWIPVEQG
ncbi:MAG: HAMP domain-containing protein [Desulfarculus sp.]|nr:HAMP domain-containing protein [Desulfarculus sp.]